MHLTYFMRANFVQVVHIQQRKVFFQMEMNFLTELKKSPPAEVFIDTIKGRHPADEMVPVEVRWEWDGKRRYHYAGGLPFLNATAKLLFKHHKDKPYDGNVLCEFSAPKVLYDNNNVCGVFYKDRNTLFCEAKELMTDYCINVDLAAIPVDFRTFDITRIDHSFCFFPKNDEEQTEFFSLFRKMYHKNLKPGKLCSQKYDFPNAYAFTSRKLDIVLYDKAAQLNLTDVKLLRIEFRCKEAFKGESEYGSDYFDSFDNTMKNANKWFAKKLEKYNFTLSFVPRNEYIEAVTKCYEAKKAEYKSRSGKKPLYLLHPISSLLEKMEQINKEGCNSFHSASKTNRCWYNRCLSLANDAGVHILYTNLDHELSFFDDVCHHKDLHRVFKPIVIKLPDTSPSSVDFACNALFHNPIESEIQLPLCSDEIRSTCKSLEQSFWQESSIVNRLKSKCLLNTDSFKEKTLHLCSDEFLSSLCNSSSAVNTINNVHRNRHRTKRALPLCSDEKFNSHAYAPIKVPYYHRRI